MLLMENVQKVYRTEHVETDALKSIQRPSARRRVRLSWGPRAREDDVPQRRRPPRHVRRGRYELDGQDVSRLGDTALSRIRNTKIGFIFQTFNLIPDLDVYDNVDVPLRYRGLGAAARRKAIEEALSTVGLGSRMKHHPSQLSGGEQQRVAIARALAAGPG